MSFRQLGDSGLVVSVAGLGCNTFGATLAPQDVPALVAAALDAGITFFDTADVYGGVPGQSEELLGAALAGHRDDVVIATKFGMDTRGLNGPDWGVRGSRRYVRRAVESSLTRLRTDHVDLLQMHAPDPVTPIEETLAALHELVVEGKVRYIGSSNFAAWQVVDADWSARTAGTTPFVSAQNRYNLLDRGAEAELVPAAEQVGVGLIPFVPLASGLLTGKYRRGESAPEGSRLTRMPERLARADFGRIEALESLAAGWGIDLPTLALGGLAAQPAVATVIAGARTPEQLRANVASIAWEPTLEQLAAIDEAAPGPAS
ncbi:aldo/keto reductase [Cellulomonas fengjieae]|uniref:Aldo/keto reductase n=1 Tax=Cellulomonas fengjieae TaxID=2819978 RepID=A0ABS3SIM2_9CELL|nr:aldo/keto reductase [Cellulomonas fengjieae]MBO3085597.1 aldo/keto reductase [Cellulomonas fengjieae]MBO3102705.1 aldo/keto reductase [Cellulomonas fengjieae]QVI67683.1 aldo/keto reductase [Cellulomonas fengjieae]